MSVLPETLPARREWCWPAMGRLDGQLLEIVDAAGSWLWVDQGRGADFFASAPEEN
ncbi:hypothetical protein [Mycolicibacterium nivoides]|uniref:Uncharacterized protein n=1 Tax=Mycolicibacterium nivoides TaxID=2487344 RepID=A0ABW9LLB6_9MYCO